MSASLNIYPFQDTESAIRFSVQVIVFLVGLIVAYRLIIKPAEKLDNERKKRTQGNVDDAKKNFDKVASLEQEYVSRFNQAVEDAKKQKHQLVSDTHKKAAFLIDQNKKIADNILEKAQSNIDEEVAKAKQSISQHAHSIADIISEKIGFTVCFFFLLATIATHTPVLASTEDVFQTSWHSIFWPYFQFIVFILAFIYFAKKPFNQLLDDKRSEFKARLSEAKEAVLMAERKVEEYHSKIQMLTSQIEKIREQNLFDANVECEKIISEAQKISQSILDDAERATQEIINSNIEKIRRELFALAVTEVTNRLENNKSEAVEAKLKLDAIECLKSLSV